MFKHEVKMPGSTEPRGAGVSKGAAPAHAQRHGHTWYLDALLTAAGVDMSARSLPPVQLSGIASHSSDVEPGNLFVAIRGTQTDGHAFIEDAIQRGAAALLVEREVSGLESVPVVQVDDVRGTLAEIAAAYHDRPAERLRLVGITGTVGKTSVLSLLEATLSASGFRPGAIGSLGLHVEGRTVDVTEHTTPDAVRLQKQLGLAVAEGCDIVAMEVTSHALMQRRVHGLVYELGIFTNLLPLEHADYHGSFRRYVDAKSRFFEHLAAGAPLVYNGDDAAVDALAKQHDVALTPCGFGAGAAVRLESVEMDVHGTRLELAITRRLIRVDGRTIEPTRLTISLQLRGSSNLHNAVLAATAALCLGADAEAVRGALTAFPPPRRRMQILRQEPFTVLDDTIGHPESVNALFEVVAMLRPPRLHVVFAIRGRRGPHINEQTAATFANWAVRYPPETLIVTRSEDAANELNRVEPEERDAFVTPLLRAGLPVAERDRMRDAVIVALERAEPGDVVLLLGAQGMDDAAGVVDEWMAARAQ